MMSLCEMWHTILNSSYPAVALNYFQGGGVGPKNIELYIFPKSGHYLVQNLENSCLKVLKTMKMFVINN